MKSGDEGGERGGFGPRSFSLFFMEDLDYLETVGALLKCKGLRLLLISSKDIFPGGGDVEP